MANLTSLIKENAGRWKAAKLTRRADFDAVAKKLAKAKGRYQAIERSTGVPWFVIAVIHQREASGNFSRGIAQGDPWNKKSTHVPKGRGPFKSFEDAAVDALTNCAPRAARWKDWTAGGALSLLEQYNGIGYANRGMASPYIWSGTNQYTKGKYVADHVFDPNAVDRQLGCAGLIMAMRAIDPSIRFSDEIPAPPDIETVPLPTPKPKITPTVHTVTTATVTAGSAVAAAQAGLPWWQIALIAAAASAVAFFAIHLVKKG